MGRGTEVKTVIGGYDEVLGVEYIGHDACFTLGSVFVGRSLRGDPRKCRIVHRSRHGLGYDLKEECFHLLVQERCGHDRAR